MGLGQSSRFGVNTLVFALLFLTTATVSAQQSGGEVQIRPIGESWETLEKLEPNLTPIEATESATSSPSSEAVGGNVQIGTPAFGRNEVKVSRRYSAKGVADCLKCHDETEQKPILSILKTPHAKMADERSPFAKRGCETCHGPSAEHFETQDDDEGKILPAITFGSGADKNKISTQNGVCMGCHTSDTTMHWQGSQHEGADLACASCHTIHAKNDPVLDLVEQKEVCFTCHKQQRAQTHLPSTHPIKAGQVSCANCHNSHGTPGDKLLVKGSVVETCYQCHADKRGPFLWEHAPVREDCTICHTPHGSVNKRLLKQRPPWLCQRCHSASGHPRSLYDDSDLSGGSFFMVRKACLNCHSQVHGSNHPSGTRMHR